MIKIFFDKKTLLTLGVIGMLCGILVACIEIAHSSDLSLEVAYIYARDGYIALNNKEYNADVFNCTLNLILFIPIISQKFIDDYDIAKSFIFVRLKKRKIWYKYKTVQSAWHCLFSCFIYNFFLLSIAALMGFKTDNAFIVFKYFIMGVCAGFLILFTIVQTNNVISLKNYSQITTVATMSITIATMAVLSFLRSEYVQYHLLANYFISWHMTLSENNFLYSYPTWIYYILLVVIIIIEVFIGDSIAKKTDCF